jgi:hypothetical protein
MRTGEFGKSQNLQICFCIALDITFILKWSDMAWVQWNRGENISPYKLLIMYILFINLDNNKRHFSVVSLQIKTFKNLILSVILYGPDIWFLALNDEHT